MGPGIVRRATSSSSCSRASSSSNSMRGRSRPDPVRGSSSRQASVIAPRSPLTAYFSRSRESGCGGPMAESTVLMCRKRGGPAPSGAPGKGPLMKRSLAAATLILATVIAACAPAATGGPSPTSANQPKKGGTLILARAGEATNLDPHKVPAFTSARVFELVYSYLMRLDENLGVQPDLAESVPTTSSDGKTVTVKIRSGVKFHNGDPLTSTDVKYTFDRILDTKTAAVARSFFSDVDTITAPDATTVVFNLKNPNAALIAYMAHPNTGIVSKKIGEANADLSKKETAIGSGPFKLAEWVPDNFMRFDAKAKQLLQEANVGPVSFTMLTQTTEPAYAKDIAQLVKAQLAEIGVDMKIETLEFTQWVDRWLKADFDMAPGLNGGGPDPDFYVYRYFTDDGNLNFVTSYKNPVSSDAIKQARAATDPAKRKDLYTTAQKELVNGVPFIWLFVGRDYVATLPTTKGFIHLPTGSIIYLRQTWLDK